MIREVSEPLVGKNLAPSALVMPAGFLAVAADFHVAPAAGAVLALVDEEPGTGIGSAFSYSVHIRRSEEFGGRVGDGPQRGLQIVPARFGPAS